MTSHELRRHTLPACRLLVQQLLQTHNKENINTLHYCPFERGSTGDPWFPSQMISNAENVSMFWSHKQGNDKENGHSPISIWIEQIGIIVYTIHLILHLHFTCVIFRNLIEEEKLPHYISKHRSQMVSRIGDLIWKRKCNNMTFGRIMRQLGN